MLAAAAAAPAAAPAAAAAAPHDVICSIPSEDFFLFLNAISENYCYLSKSCLWKHRKS